MKEIEIIKINFLEKLYNQPKITTKMMLADDMLGLIELIDILEDNKQKAYQVKFYAQKVILLLTENSVDYVTNYLKNEQIADDFAREFFKRYIDGRITRTHYYNYNQGKGNDLQEELKKQYLQKNIEFFI